MAEEREGRSSARDMAWRLPISCPSLYVFVVVSGVGAVCPFVLSAFVVDGGGVATSFCVCGWEVGRMGVAGRVCEAWTSHGSQPPGAWVIFAFSRPRRRGMEGPVRSMSRMPTECPARDNERASWVVMEDLPTPPLPERICGGGVSGEGVGQGSGAQRAGLTSTMCLTLSRDIPLG